MQRTRKNLRFPQFLWQATEHRNNKETQEANIKVKTQKEPHQELRYQTRLLKISKKKGHRRTKIIRIIQEKEKRKTGFCLVNLKVRLVSIRTSKKTKTTQIKTKGLTEVTRGN